jgi:electron transfer flavoprotein alpha subunit
MSNVLIMLEHTHGALRKTSLSAITFGQQVAQKSGGEVHLLLVGDKIKEAAQALTGYGAAKIYTVEASCYAHYLAESYTAAVVFAAKASGATCVAAASSSTTKDLLPRVAARLQAGMATDVLSVVEADTYTRPMWAGNVVATVQLTSKVRVASVRATEFLAPTVAAGATPIESLSVTVPMDTLKTKFLGLKEVKSERPDVTTAERIVSGGRGVKGAEGFKVIEQLADAMRAGVGASRAVCDAGWVGNDLQIGQTGKIVAPNLYVAVGISGAIQHLAGMKGSKTIVAINKDPEAPIFQVADYGLVADLFTAVPELIKQLKAGA